MAEVQLLKLASAVATRHAPGSDSIRLVSIGVGTAGVPVSGIVDCGVGLNLAGQPTAVFSGTTLTLGGSSWTTSAKLVAGSGGSVVASPSGTDTWTLTNASNVVSESLVSTATSITRTQATLASGTGAAMTISAQSSAASGAGGALNLQSGSGSVTSGVVNIQPGGSAFLALSKSGSSGLITMDSSVTSLAYSFSTTSAGPGGSMSFTGGNGASGFGGGGLTFTAGTAGSGGFGGSVSIGAGNGTGGAGTISLKVANTTKFQVDGSSNILTLPTSAVVGGMVGGVALGAITTTPTSSAANQAQLWNNTGVLTYNGWGGHEFFAPPTGQGSGAPIRIGVFGLGGESSDAANTSPEIFIEFADGIVAAPYPLNSFVSGSGAFSSQVGLASHPGIRAMTTGTTAASKIVMMAAPSIGGIAYVINADDWVFEAEVQLTALSVTGSQEYTCYVGWFDNFLNSVPNNGCFFTYTLNGGSTFWRFGGLGTGAVAVANSSVTVTANSWYRLRIAKVGSTITFYINGVSVGTNATVCTANVAPAVQISSTVGVTSKVLNVDYMKWSTQFVTAR